MVSGDRLECGLYEHVLVIILASTPRLVLAHLLLK